MKKAVALLGLLAWCALAQQQHVVWTPSVEPAAAAPGGKVLVRIDGKIENGWHLYSASSATGIPTSFKIGPDTVVAATRLLQTPPHRAFDPNFNAESETYEGDAAFLVETTLRKDAPAGAQQLTIAARFQTCTSTVCVPGKWSGTVALTIDPAAAAAAPAIPAGFAAAKAPTPAESGGATQASSQGWVAFLAVAFGFGLASIFTPCVFPMIPITMSYFLNRQSGGRRDAVVQAVVFCLGIVVLFSGLGLVTTLALGPAGVKNLGASPWVNGFITLLFTAFGLSLLGAFEINIPSSVLTKLNASSGSGSFAGTLLMGLTFSLSSFACVGPFVGTLLAASVGGGGMRPLAGMVVFAGGLALPFFLLALFPSYLQRMPRSGGWLSRVKVVLGFVILASGLDYLAKVDQTLQWGFVTRERFLAAWIVLFAMAGLYLLGFLRLEGIKPDETMGMWRLLIGMVFLIFAISLAPGMFGGKLGELDAYIPEAQGGLLAGGGGGSTASQLVWMKDQYREALDRARREGKLVFVDFTGYACTNCHWMRANMLSRPEIADRLKNFVLLELYTDGTDAASEANGKLQLEKFHTVEEPYYVILDPDERVVAKFEGLTKDAAAYAAFLDQGLAKPAPAVAAATAATGPDIGPVLSLEGGTLSQSAFAGKVVLVDFWATWCLPCLKEFPEFNRLQKEYESKGLVVLGVSADEEGAEKVKPYLKDHRLDYLVGLASPEQRKRFDLEALPLTIVYDRTGKQVAQFVGLTEESKIEAAVKSAL
jgi:thiol:disulfide interchange protein